MCRSGEDSGDAVQKTDASVHRLVRYSLHIQTNELAHFFTKWPFSYEKFWLFFLFSLKQWLMAFNGSL